VAYCFYFGLLPHSGGANFAFFDGHVERRAKANVPDISSGEGRTFWTGQ
jgi:prepilin-type processing-associated H-X9-DG protein